LQDKYGVQVYLEPGEAVALNAGWLVTTVLDTLKNGMDLAIVDTSAACHMPDVLEMPYRPFIIGSGEAGEKAYTYRLGGPTCLAGDVIGDYSFDEPLKAGDRLMSVRDVAVSAGVTPNTVQKSFEQLEQQGVIYSIRGSGWYVSDNSRIARDTLDKLVHDKTVNYLNDMQSLGLDKRDIIEIIKEFRYG
jgi:DNA-binding transcriptional regulator YhcF (GntR family)